MNNKQFYLGIDVGGSKTHALLADQHGQVAGFGQAGPGNHETVGFSGLEQALHQATGQALQQAGISIDQIGGAGFGVGGFDWPCEREEHLRTIATLGITAPCELVNDTIIGLLAGSRRGWGIASVSGTGCNCWGMDSSHHIAHMTGSGGAMGESAGASELVGEAIIRVSRAWSKRGPETRLCRAFIDLFGAKNLDDLIIGLTQGHYYPSASAAQMVFQIAAEGDAVAQDVIRWAGEGLADMVLGVARQLHFEMLSYEVVLVGSLFKGGPLLIEPMRQAILEVTPGADLIPLETPPVVGATLLGMQQAGLPLDEMRLQLIESTHHFLVNQNGY